MRIVIVFIISLLSVFIITACGQSTAQPVMVDAFEGLDELERFPYEVKLPGHLPFKAIEASARIAREREPLGDNDKKYYLLSMSYKSENPGEETLLIQVENRNRVIRTQEIGEQEQLVELNDGTPALYTENRIAMFLNWNDGELNYDIAIPNSEEHAVETLIKIAESFVSN